MLNDRIGHWLARWRGRTVVVEGVVGTAGVCGESIAGSGVWTLRFGLSPWNEPGCTATSEPLQVHRRCRLDELESAQRALPPNTHARLRVRFTGGSPLRAELVRILRPERTRRP